MMGNLAICLLLRRPKYCLFDPPKAPQLSSSREVTRIHKKGTMIFAEMKQLVQRLQSVITKQRTIWDNITLVVALDFLYDNFEMTTTPLLHSNNKGLEEI